MLKNFIFYAFSTFINTWAGEKGAGDVFKVYGITSICLLTTCIPMCKTHLLLKLESHTMITANDVHLDIFGKMNRKFMRDVHARYKIFRALG